MLAAVLLMQPIVNSTCTYSIYVLFIGHFSLSLLSYENVQDKISVLVGVEEVTKKGS